jgi:hypothetical protein
MSGKSNVVGFVGVAVAAIAQVQAELQSPVSLRHMARLWQST